MYKINMVAIKSTNVITRWHNTMDSSKFSCFMGMLLNNISKILIVIFLSYVFAIGKGYSMIGMSNDLMTFIID